MKAAAAACDVEEPVVPLLEDFPDDTPKVLEGEPVVEPGGETEDGVCIPTVGIVVDDEAADPD